MSDDPARRRAMPAQPSSVRPARTYVVCRYLGPAFFAGHPTNEPELAPLGTVEAPNAAEARARAAAAWPDVPQRALRVRTARAVSAGVLIAALTRDGARARRTASDA